MIRKCERDSILEDSCSGNQFIIQYERHVHHPHVTWGTKADERILADLTVIVTPPSIY